MRYQEEQSLQDYSPQLDAQQLAQLVMAVRAAQQFGQGPGLARRAAGQPVAQAPDATSALVPAFGLTDPFAPGATAIVPTPLPSPNPDKLPVFERLPYLRSDKPPVYESLPYLRSQGPPTIQQLLDLKPAAKAMFIQTLRQQAPANPQEQAPRQTARPLTKHYLGVRDSQYADSLKQAADYLRWRDQNFRPATAGGWEAPSGRVYRDEDLHELYSAQQQEAARAQQTRE